MEDFEWNEEKARANWDKHGVDFEDAISIFDGFFFEAEDDRFDYGEARMVAVGAVGGHALAVVYTMRANTCRIISARKANRNERYAYHKAVAERSPPG